MGETFYTVLGVSSDADDGAVRRAYRRAVKECHPDVSDDPAASERFKRLTTARDVLLDADERKTYDRLGHAAYVDQHVDTSVWEAEQGEQSTTAEQTTTTSTQRTDSTWSTSGRTQRTTAGATHTDRSSKQRDARQNTDDTNRTRTSRRQRRWNQRQSSRADGGYDQPWQRAPDAYQRTQTTRRRDSRTSVFDALRAIGPWLFIHLVLITSALTTSGSLLGRVTADPAGTVATGLFSVLLVAVVLLLSFLHILTEVS